MTTTSEPFFRALTEGRLELPFCPRCGAGRWYPGDVCAACACLDRPLWRPVRDTGVVDASTTVHRSFVEGISVPYRVGLVRIDDAGAIRLVARLFPSPGGTPPSVGAIVRLVPGPDPTRIVSFAAQDAPALDRFSDLLEQTP